MHLQYYVIKISMVLSYDLWTLIDLSVLSKFSIIRCKRRSASHRFLKNEKVDYDRESRYDGQSNC